MTMKLSLELVPRAPPSDGVRWDLPSKAVVASKDGDGCVLYTAGPHVKSLQEETGTHRLDDLGLDDAPDGISVWEGKITGGGYDSFNGDYHDTFLKGEFREPTHYEWQMIREGQCPWNEWDWTSDDAKELQQKGVVDGADGVDVEPLLVGEAPREAPAEGTPRPTLDDGSAAGGIADGDPSAGSSDDGDPVRVLVDAR